MSKENKNIDQLLKDRLYNREFEFDEHAWKGARKLLDQQGKKGGGYFRKSLYGLLALLFISGTAYVAFNSNNDSPPINDTLISPQTAITEDMAQPVEIAKSNDNTSNNSEILKNNDGLISSDINSNSENYISNNLHAKEEINDQVSQNHPTSQPQEVAVASPATIQPQKNSGDSKSTPHNINPESMVLDEANSPKNGTIAPVPVANKIESKKLSTPTTNNNKVRNQTIKNTRKTTNSEQPAFLASNNTERLVAISPNYNVEYEKEVIPPAKIDEVEVKKDKSPKVIGLQPGWSLIGGGGLGFSNLQLDESKSSPFNSLIGVRYVYPLNFRFSLQGNLLFTNVYNLNAPIEITEQDFDFGYNNKTTTITTKRMSQISLPLYANYYFANRYNAYMGVQFSQLLTALSEKKELKESDFSEPGENAKSTNSRGYVDHIQAFQVSGIAGAEYLLNPKMGVGLRYQYNFSNTMLHKYTGEKNFKHQFISITFTYKIGD